MPFHVEIRRSLRRASVFNLDEEKLSKTVLEPWRRARGVQLGDQEWDPRECTLTILEGPALNPSELAHGRGWGTAERSARDVTASVLNSFGWAALAVAVLAETPEAERHLTDLVAQLGVRSVDWAAVRARVVAAAMVVAERPFEDLGALAVVIVVDRPDPSPAWLFEAGLALGALGGRAVVVQIGGHAPPELGELPVIRLDPQRPVSLHSLAERLRHASR
jgi:hypothetical protein